MSFPGPDRSVTIEGLKSYRVSNRRYRNRRIGDFLKELHLTEGRNTGFKKILDALDANGSPKPEFEMDEVHSYFISRFFIHESFLEEKSGMMSGSALPYPNLKQFDKDREELSGSAQKNAQKSAQKSNKYETLLQYCHEPRTREDMMGFLGIKHRTTFRNNYLKPMLEAGMLFMTYPEKPRSKNQKFYSRT